jgi:hypothetical protein
VDRRDFLELWLAKIPSDSISGPRSSTVDHGPGPISGDQHVTLVET